MSDIKKYGLTGVGSEIQLGKGGAKLKSNAGVVEARTADGANLAVIRAAMPSGINDVITKKYLETRADVVVVGEIYDDSSTLAFSPSPANANTMFLCTETGNGYTEGTLYFCTTGGIAGVAVFETITPYDGMRISIASTLSNGTTSFTGDHLYLYSGTAWVDIGPAATISSVVKIARADISSATPDGAVSIGPVLASTSAVVKVVVNVSVAFDGTTDSLISIGKAGSVSSIGATSEVDLMKVGTYVVECYVKPDAQVIATLAKGTGNSAGTATIEMHYSVA